MEVPQLISVENIPSPTLVEALDIVETDGLSAAVQYLMLNNIPIPVIARLLKERPHHAIENLRNLPCFAQIE